VEMSERNVAKLIVVAICLMFAALVMPSMVETVDNGTYQVRQWPVSGSIDVKMTPGMWWQCFGNTQTWPKAETFYFTEDPEGATGPDDTGDASIEVTFNDGSKCRISGTCRVEMPKTEEQAKNLIMVLGLRSHNDVEEKLVKPCLRNALILTANMMTARESYSEKRIDFVMTAWDQVQHGLYEFTEEVTEVKDPVTGIATTKKIKIPLTGNDGKIIRQPQSNIFEGTGIVLSNFEVKKFLYEDKVQQQIAQQQEATMAVITAMAQAKRAEQDRLRIEAEGKAAVTKAQYEKEQEKIRAVTDALKDKEVAVTKAEQEKEVAVLARDAAAMTKDQQILLGQGEAERKKLVMDADGALQQKLSAWLDSQKVWADAFARRNVPSVVMGEKGAGQDGSASDFMSMLTIKAAKDLALDMSMKGSVPVAEQ